MAIIDREITSIEERNQVQDEIRAAMDMQHVSFGVVKDNSVGTFEINQKSPYRLDCWTRSCGCVHDGDVSQDGKTFRAKVNLYAHNYHLPAYKLDGKYYLISQKGNGGGELYTDLQTGEYVELTKEDKRKAEKTALGEFSQSVTFYYHKWTPMYEILSNLFLQRHKLKPSISVDLTAYIER